MWTVFPLLYKVAFIIFLSSYWICKKLIIMWTIYISSLCLVKSVREIKLSRAASSKEPRNKINVGVITKQILLDVG